MCSCIIICQCDNQSDSHYNATSSTGPKGGVACLLGKTRPPGPTIGRADANIFDIKNQYRTYAYTLSPKTVGIMAGKSRDRQYETLKRLHAEVLNQFKCSYIINIELYTNDDDNLHCHGLIRFKSHSDKTKAIKLLKAKITMNRKGTYKNLIDCEFINNFQSWADYIFKAQYYILTLNYEPFVHIDYSFHQTIDGMFVLSQTQTTNPKKSTKKKNKNKDKIQAKIDKLNFELEILKKSLEI